MGVGEGDALIQATALLVAIALTVTVPAAQSEMSCEQIQKRAAPMTMAQVRASMDRMKLPQEWRDLVETCLRDKK